MNNPALMELADRWQVESTRLLRLAFELRANGDATTEDFARSYKLEDKAEVLHECMQELRTATAEGGGGEVGEVIDALAPFGDPIAQMRNVCLVARERDALISRKWVEGWADQWEQERNNTHPPEVARDAGHVHWRGLWAIERTMRLMDCGLSKEAATKAMQQEERAIQQDAIAGAAGE